MRYGLLGRHLGHSHSPLIHETLGMPDYRLFPTEPEAVEAFLKSGELGGLNVTIPYKQTVMRFCDALSETARRAGAVNTLLFGSDGRIYGHNTDYDGLRYLARRAGVAFSGRKVVILGSGGASAVAALLARDAGARAVVQISRRGPDNYQNLARHADAEVLVNATPVGMYPENGDTPLSPEVFPALAGVLDLIYNPLRTRLVLAARARGIPAAGGLPMLAEQGRAAAALFQGREIAEAETERVFSVLRRAAESIVLTGMPGSGKTAVGQAAATLLGRRFLDTDTLVTEETGRTPAEWITEDGEAAFREIEARAVARAARESGLVLATGGGAVLRPENREALRQNGRVYWLRRPLRALAVEGRPLSAGLAALYEKRRPLYEAAADVTIDAADGAADGVADAARRIAEEFCL